MKAEILAKVKAEVDAWEYMGQLPPQCHGFVLQRCLQENGDRYEIFCYTATGAKQKPMGLYAYFHEETKEYKLRLKLGLVEFVLIEFIVGSLAVFEERLQKYLTASLDKLVGNISREIHPLLAQTKILEWEYGEVLPDQCEGFFLVEQPNSPFPVANGSYLIISYANFGTSCGLNIYYNIFRDEFFGESYLDGSPTVTYDFDAKNIAALAECLRKRLVTHLRTVKKVRAC